jgi:competence protein ComEC
VLADPDIGGLADAAPARLRLRVAGEGAGLRLGDSVVVRAKVGPPPPPSIPDSYDFQRHAFFEGIGAVGFAYGAPRLAERAASSGPSAWLGGLRLAMTERILPRLPGAAGGIAVALVTGEQAAIPRADLTAMRDSGLAHLLSISGLHMAFVAGILFVGLRAALALVPSLALNHPIKKWTAAAALLGTLFYLLLSGSSVPAQRAFIMTGLVLAAILLDRSAVSMRLVAWAALALLLLRPEALLGASFQMSFAAVVALVAAFEATRDWRRRRLADAGMARRAAYYALDLGLTSLIAMLATAPYAAFHFNRFADYALAANLLAVPLTGVWIMPWAVAAAVLMPAGLDGLALAPMGWGIDAMLWIAHAIADLPGAVVLIPSLPLAGLALVTLGGLWLCLWRRRWRLFGVAGILAGAVTPALVDDPDLLVSGDGRLVAARGEDGDLRLSSTRAARFDADMWLRRSGQDERLAWPDGVEELAALACDDLGCLYRRNGHLVALVRRQDALAEDCAVADLVVSLEPVGDGCPAPLVIDRFDL